MSSNTDDPQMDDNEGAADLDSSSRSSFSDARKSQHVEDHSDTKDQSLSAEDLVFAKSIFAF